MTSGAMICFYPKVITFLILHVAIYANAGQNRCNMSGMKSINGSSVANITATCKKEQYSTTNAYYEIKWPNAAEKVDQYVVVIGSADTIHEPIQYFKQSGKKHSFHFEKEKHGFDQSKIYCIHVLAVRRGNSHAVQKDKDVIKTDKCPEQLNIAHPWQHKDAKIGENFTFDCTFTGRPAPSVSWSFSHDLEKCDNPRPYPHNKHLTLSHDKQKLEISDITEDEQGCYKCHVDNKISSGIVGTLTLKVIGRIKEKQKQILVPVLVSVGFVFIFIIVAIMVYKLFFSPNKLEPVMAPENPVCTLYICHCATRGKDKKRILELANVLQQNYNTEVIMDLICRVPIHAAGGMYQWLPQTMQRANKIMVVVCTDYLNVLDTKKADEDTQKTDCQKALKTKKVDEDTQKKIHAEYDIVRRILYNTLQKTDRLIFINDGVKQEHFSTQFNGRPSFPFPQCDDDIVAILGFLSGQEILQLPTVSNIV